MYYAKYFHINNKLVKEIVIPETVTVIEDYTFCGFEGVTSVTIPDSVISIGNSAFRGCTALTSITIPDNVTSIGDYAFYYCDGLTSVTIPDSLTRIGAYAFYQCSGLDFVLYSGTEDAWNEILIGSNNDPLINAVKYFETKSIESKVENGFSYHITGKIVALISYAGTDSQVVIPETVDGKPVTKIIDNAFKNNTTMTSVVIPESVKTIGGYAFCDCTNLTSITIPDSVTSIGYYAFCDCTNLTSITIPDSVTSIGYYAFYNCTSLTSITLGDSITSIGDSAFKNCDGIAQVYYTGDVESWCGIAFGNGYANPLQYANDFYINNNLVTEIVIPETVTEIKNFQFRGFKSITSVTMPDSVVSVGYSSFSNCKALKTVTIGDGVTNIDDYAFYNCTSLRKLTMPASAKICDSEDTFYGCTEIYNITLTKGTGKMQNYTDSTSEYRTQTYYQYTPWYISGCAVITIEDGVENIGKYTFFECSSLKLVTIPDSVTSIGSYAFYYCKNLTSVTIPDSVTSISDYAFCYCKNLISVTIPDNVTSIGSYAFGSCDSLASVKIGNNVTNIGDGAFYSCEGLTSVTIPYGVTSIGVETFYNCRSLVSVTIPDSVTNIGNRAFCNCLSLCELTMSASVVFYSKTFDYCHVKKVTLTKGTGIMRDFSSSYTPWDVSGRCTEIVIEDGIEYISDYAFSSCSSLTSVTIPVSVTGIREKAFYKCDNIKTVLYEGTRAQWDEISIYDGNESIENSTIVCLADHTHSYSSTIVQPTCTEDGSETFVCVCGHTYTESISATGHEKIVASETPPTCTETGVRYYECSFCGYNGRNEVVYSTSDCPQSSHNYSNNISQTKSFSSPGALKLILEFSSNTKTESNFDYIYIYNKDGSLYGIYSGAQLSDKTIELDGDSFSIKLTSDISNVYYGYSFDSITAIMSFDSDNSYQEVIPTTSHKFGDWKITTQPTITTDGVKVRECSVCGETETGVEPKTGITVILTDSNGNVVSEQVIEGDLSEVTFDDIEDGEYTVTLSKETYASREYTVTAIDGKAEAKFKLNHTGDINGDGKISVLDYTQLLRHVKKTSSLDGYAFDCADVNGDGKLSVLDYTKLLRHVKKTEMLW